MFRAKTETAKNRASVARLTQPLQPLTRPAILCVFEGLFPNPLAGPMI
jgi:hypothetical protein